jgi:hypothetical protein
MNQATSVIGRVDSWLQGCKIRTDIGVMRTGLCDQAISFGAQQNHVRMLRPQAGGAFVRCAQIASASLHIPLACARLEFPRLAAEAERPSPHRGAPRRVTTAPMAGPRQHEIVGCGKRRIRVPFGRRAVIFSCHRGSMVRLRGHRARSGHHNRPLVYAVDRCRRAAFVGGGLARSQAKLPSRRSDHVSDAGIVLVNGRGAWRLAYAMFDVIRLRTALSRSLCITIL